MNTDYTPAGVIKQLDRAENLLHDAYDIICDIDDYPVGDKIDWDLVDELSELMENIHYIVNPIQY